MDTRRLIIASALAIGILLPGCSPTQNADPAGNDSNEAIEASDYQSETYEVASTAKLELSNINGSVSVKTGKPGQVTITATRFGRGKDDAEARSRLGALSVKLQRNGDTITAVASAGNSWNGKEVDLAIVAQEDASIKASGASGSIRVAGITGGVDIAGSSVTANLSNIKGGVSIATKGGAVFIDGASGPSKMETQDAPISIIRLSSPALTVASNSDVTIKDTQTEGDLAVKSVSGKLNLQRLKAGAIRAEASKGSIEMVETTADHGITLQTDTGRVYVRRVNSELLKIATTAGPLEISEVQGGMELATPGGQIDLSRVTPSSLAVKGGSGNVTLDGQFPQPGTASITTTSGDISISVPRESSLALNANTKKGKVTLDPRFGMAPPDKSAGTVSGKIAGGAVQLTLTSDSGDIAIDTGQP